jgi:hypothetical protein
MRANDHERRRRSNGAAPSVSELVEQSQRVREDLVNFAGAARHVAHGWRALLRARLERRPYATLAVAAGVGYVLGGGVPTALVRVLVGVGGRLALERVVAQLVDAPGES